MDYNAFKELVVRAAEAAGLKDYELYYSAAESTSVSTYKHAINDFSSTLEGGVCFRTLVNGHMGYASTESLTEDEAEAIVKRAAENALLLETEEPEFLGEGGGTYRELPKQEETLPDAAFLVRSVLQCEQMLYDEDPAVIDGSGATAGTESSTVAICNSRGIDLQDSRSVAFFYAEAVVSDGEKMSNAYEVKTGITEEHMKEAVSKSVEEAKQKLTAEVAPTGSAPVILSPGAMRSLLAVYSSAFSAENAQKGLSLLAGKEGTAVASPLVTLVDDPFYPESLFPRAFDAEGMPTCTKAVIENGELKTLLYNLKTAAVAGRKTTGNAAKAGYAAPVGIRPFTFVLKPGDKSEAELLAMADGGVYVDELQGTHAGANPISGDFSLQSMGYLVRDGKKAGAVKDFTTAGNFFELLKNIKALGDTAEKDKFAGVSGFAAPAVLADGLSIAGK
ncbi:MAG: TldD/PmbA family protein [Lachnospiraceae bacterium]|nr:TldD/PmbA family protein [Lachnospiraceae bacterium]